jgi:hypothetical protein
MRHGRRLWSWRLSESAARLLEVHTVVIFTQFETGFAVTVLRGVIAKVGEQAD